MSTLLPTATLEIAAIASLLQHTPDAQAGFVWLFIVMACTPYVLLFVIGGGIFRAKKKQREQELERALLDQESWESTQHAEDSGRPA